MMKPNVMIMIMFIITTMNLLTSKTSIMCLNLMMFIAISALTISMKMKLTPIPFIIFLTMIGGLMIIFLYLVMTLWMKKEKTIKKLKPMSLTTSALTLILLTKAMSSTNSNNSINMFDNNINKITITMITMLTMMLIFTIDILMKVNLPFRRKLKIWE